MNRRNFLQASIAGLSWQGLLSLIASQSQAESLGANSIGGVGNVPPKLMVISFEGGWDVTLGLDPWTSPQRLDQSEIFIEYRHDELIASGSNFYGPALAPMVPHLGDFSVIRGVFLNELDNGHDAARMLMTTGNGEGKNPHFAADATSIWGYGGRRNIVSDVSVYSANRIMRTLSLNSLEYRRDNLKSGLLDLPGGEFQSVMSQGEFSSAEYQEFNKWKDLLCQGVSDNVLRSALIGAAALKSGIAYAMVKGAGVSLDTHSNHEKTHLASQAKAWDFVSQLVTKLKGIPGESRPTFFDEVTLVIMSEFSRTPALNLSKGKDHNPRLNAVMVSGPRIRRGQFIGGSRLVASKDSHEGRSYHIGMPYDLYDKKVVTSKKDFLLGAGIIITPEVLMATYCEALGIHRSLWACANNEVRSLSSLIV